MDRPPLDIAFDVVGRDAEVLRGLAHELLPARPGLIVLDGASSVVQIAATGDLRGFFVDRVVERRDGRADLSGVVERVRAVALGSALEADLAFLEWGRELTPESYRAAADRWRGWFLRLDPASDVPVWRKTNLSDCVGADPATLIGPIPSKDSAARFGRAMDSVFELCREPKLLKQRPNATACGYKEMGLCPAACDGSEPMSAYLGRVGEALAMAETGSAAWAAERLAPIEAAMERASAALEFEHAATLKVRGEALGVMTGRSFRDVTRLDVFAAALVLPSTRRRWCRVILHARGRTAWWGDVAADGVKAASAAVVAGCGRLAASAMGWAGGSWLTADAIERIGLVCRSLAHTPRGSGRVVPVRLGGDAEEAAGRLVRVMRKVCRAEEAEDSGGSRNEHASADGPGVAGG